MPPLRLTHDIQTWPLWGQILLLLTIILVANFWLGKLLGSIPFNASWRDHPGLKLLTYGCLATAISWLTTSYCIGRNAAGIPFEWGFYGRILFVGQILFITQLLSRNRF